MANTKTKIQTLTELKSSIREAGKLKAMRDKLHAALADAGYSSLKELDDFLEAVGSLGITKKAKKAVKRGRKKTAKKTAKKATKKATKKAATKKTAKKASKKVARKAAKKAPRTTPEEKERALQMIKEGRTDKEVAAAIGKSAQTVYNIKKQNKLVKPSEDSLTPSSATEDRG